MKVAIASDLHLGHLYGNPREKRRWDDSFRAADEVVEIANTQADILVLAGDLFDKKKPDLKVLIKSIEIFKKSRIPIIAVHGNHDVRGSEKEHVLALLDRAGVIKYIHNELFIFEKEGEEISIFGVGWVPENIAPAFFLTKPPKGGDILVLHQALEGFYPYDDETPLPLSALPKGFELYVSGHMHWFAENEVDGLRILLPGSTIPTQMRDREILSNKYVCIYDTETKTIEKIPLKSSRKGYVIEEDVTGMETGEIISKITEKLSQIPAEKPEPIVKITLKGNVDKFIHYHQVLKNFEEKFILKIFDKTYQRIVEEVLELKKKYERDSEMFSERYALKVLREMLAEQGIVYEKFSEIIETLREGDGEKALELMLDDITEGERNPEMREHKSKITEWL